MNDGISAQHTCVYMIKVHCAETLLNERVVIKVLYPEIRQYMAADLANLKQAVLMISKLLSMAMKDAIEAVSTELCDNFPRELDFRIEQAFTERARCVHVRVCLCAYISVCVWFSDNILSFFGVSLHTHASYLPFLVIFELSHVFLHAFMFVHTHAISLSLSLTYTYIYIF
jgi:hypothetical protein